MNTNAIIKEFNINDITRDENNNLYLRFTIDRRKAFNRRAKFIKVCVLRIQI